MGWASAERIAMWARVHDGEEAYSFHQLLMGENCLHNVINDNRGEPLFQADAYCCASASVVDMPMQSRDRVMASLSAMPAARPKGSSRGLLARGNFEVSAQWSGGHASRRRSCRNRVEIWT
ncbi:glycoside hydrolase family 95-like protein [Rubripirellula reticaptiva]|uniref:glycoside hydrolase family 95-like protein n=1 Tax=Rubripirellula reticaptiva TaxID=2528013 RepID=UPI0036F301B0